MNSEAFFASVIGDHAMNTQEALIALAEARGFLIQKYDNAYYISDNSHKSDASYLNELLLKYHIGFIDKEKIVVKNYENIGLLVNEFSERTQIASASVWMNTKWNYFRKRRHGHKVSVQDLEPFIAYYVKAISACGVLTVGSCDGNHYAGINKRLFLQFHEKGSRVWHEQIWKIYLSRKIVLNWEENYSSISFRQDKQYTTYLQLLHAAKELYENRIQLRDIKQKAFEGMSKKYLKTGDAEEIEQRFRERTCELLSQICSKSNARILG